MVMRKVRERVRRVEFMALRKLVHWLTINYIVVSASIVVLFVSVLRRIISLTTGNLISLRNFFILWAHEILIHIIDEIQIRASRNLCLGALLGFLALSHYATTWLFFGNKVDIFCGLILPVLGCFTHRSTDVWYLGGLLLLLLLTWYRQLLRRATTELLRLLNWSDFVGLNFELLSDALYSRSAIWDTTLLLGLDDLRRLFKSLYLLRHLICEDSARDLPHLLFKQQSIGARLILTFSFKTAQYFHTLTMAQWYLLKVLLLREHILLEWCHLGRILELRVDLAAKVSLTRLHLSVLSLKLIQNWLIVHKFRHLLCSFDRYTLRNRELIFHNRYPILVSQSLRIVLQSLERYRRWLPMWLFSYFWVCFRRQLLHLVTRTALLILAHR